MYYRVPLAAPYIQVDIQARKLFGEFSNWILTHMRDIWILKPGFDTAFRAESI